MWKFLYISILLIALLAFLANIVVKDSDISLFDQITSISDRFKAISKATTADKLTGMYRVQKHYSDAMYQQLENDYYAFKDRQQRLKDQLLYIENQRNLSTSNFMSILSQDLRAAERLYMENQTLQNETAMERLRVLNQRYKDVSSKGLFDAQSDGRFDSYMTDLKRDLDMASSYVHEDQADQYRKQLDKIQSLENQRKSVVNSLNEDQRQMHEQLRHNKERMEAAQRRNDMIQEQYNQNIKASQERLENQQRKIKEDTYNQQQRMSDQRRRIEDLIRQSRGR